MKKQLIATAVALAVCHLPAQAEGYKLFEQSVSAMGNAYAGRGAQITDASLVYSNPAAIGALKQAGFAGGINFIHAETRYSDVSATSATGAAVVGRDSGKNSLNELVPFFFATAPVDDKLTIGGGFYVPFGLSGNYQNDWRGRYFADETAIEVLGLTGVASYQLTEHWRLGAGVSLNRAEGTLSKFKDHNGLCELGTGVNALYRADVYNPVYCQSYYSVTGDDLAPGYSLGVHGQLTNDLKIALVYHSALHFNLQGDSTISNTPITGANVSGLPGFIAVAPQLPAISKATGKLAANSLLTEASQLALTTPANLSFSADYQLNSAWSWQNTISWTGWSKFRSIDIQSRAEQATISLSTQQSQNLNQPGYIGYIPEYWQDSWSFATGLSWAFSSTTMLKTGLAYDGNPISQSHRTARVPTSDRVWWTLGLNQQLSHTMSLDVAAGWMWMDDVQIKEREYNVQNQPLYKSGLQGRFDNMAYVLSAQLNYWF